MKNGNAKTVFKNNRPKLKRRQKRQIAFLTVTILIAAVIAIMLLTPGFNIQKIEVYGNSAISDDDIRRASGLVTGVNIFSVSLDDAAENVKSMGRIEKVEVKRKLPSTISITVVEEIEVAYLSAKEGYVIITADGRCIDITDGISGGSANTNQQVAALPDLPIIKGMKNVKYKVGSTIQSDDSLRLNALFTCLHEFAKHGYVFDMKEIDMTDLNDIRFYYQGRELCVSIGSIDKIGYKMECFGPIYAEVVEMNKENGKPKGFIDLERKTYRKTIESQVKVEENEENGENSEEKTQ